MASATLHYRQALLHAKAIEQYRRDDPVFVTEAEQIEDGTP